MSKKSDMESNKKKIYLANTLKRNRISLKKDVLDFSLTPEERLKAQKKLAELPRNSASCRVRVRCFKTGRARGVFSKFGLSRICFREMASRGLIPGIRKASW